MLVQYRDILVLSVIFHVNRFISDYNKNGLGFQLIYESSRESRWQYNYGECGGSFTAPNGHLTSPSYPDKYLKKADCIYNITQPAGTVIVLKFLNMDIHSYSYDRTCYHSNNLEIRDGLLSVSPLLGKVLCGNSIPDPIQTTQNNLWMR